MRDPYSVLDVEKSASADEIKSAFRKLAKQYHPDVAGDSTVMARTFQEINSAYAILGDATKREQFDRGEIRADGSPAGPSPASARPHRSAADAWAAKARSGNRTANGQDTDETFKTHFWNKSGESEWANSSADTAKKAKSKADDVFNDLFQNIRGKAEEVKAKAEQVAEERAEQKAQDRARAEEERVVREKERAAREEKARQEEMRAAAEREAARKAREAAKEPPADSHFTLSVSFEDGARGTTRRVKLPNGKRLDVKIPAGVKPGQQIRLKGQGKSNGEIAGDALIEIAVQPHRHFTTEGDDVYLTLPITVDEAVLGAKVMVPTLDGPVAMKIPEGSNSDTTLRLKGRGLARPDEDGEKRFGDQYVIVKIVLPSADDSAFVEAIKKWSAGNAYEVRADFQF